MATGCVKILKKSLDFDLYGKYIPEHKRGPNKDLFRSAVSHILGEDGKFVRKCFSFCEHF